MILSVQINQFGFIAILLATIVPYGSAIRCYQCSSDQDRSHDTCGVYNPFDTVRNVPVECYSDEAHVPGIICVKITKQGPKGFIWDGRWRTVIRSCAQISETGVTSYCNWGHEENGEYWEHCYCSTDGCNSALVARPTTSLLILTPVTLIALWKSSILF